ncbi:MAG TPA: LuxR C-terminal-related transcriptional regulator [Gaiellaceae bacterium]|nr:LuxR C-terminal-related transcriptional regulator [Gaiellaceae bacterium]
MEELRRQEVRQLVAFVHDAAELQSRLPFPPELVERLSELVPAAEIVTYCELDCDRRRVAYEADQLAWARDLDLGDGYWELKPQHAVCEHFDRTGDFRPRRMSDLMPPREWRSRELYNVVFRPYQYELDVRIPSSRTGYTRTFLFHAQKRDFGERDRLVLELLRPYLERVVDGFDRRAAPEGELGLTRRERQILEWVERGKTNAEIAQVLWLSPSTVRKHLENAYGKLGVHTRTAAVARLRGH